MMKVLAHIADIGPYLKGETEIVAIYDENASWVAAQVLEALQGQVKAALALDTSEEEKTMDTVVLLERQLMEAGVSRGALVLAIGGGITTDISGFVASIYKRGIRYANFPTTLLSQVDAAIGGKTGVNLDGYKNMLGAFHMPEFTFICAPVLKTLPEREIVGGTAEMLKTFLLADSKAYEKAAAGKKGEIPEGELIGRAAEIKEQIVAEDPFEKGVRAKLNLGHTFGHAIEHQARENGDDISHGEAVAMGIILAAKLGESLGISQKGLAKRLEADWLRLGLPTECPYPLESLKEAIGRDKKALQGGKVKFVLPVEPGTVVFQELNPDDLHFDTK